MPLFYKPEKMKEKRKTNRLAEYDYSQSGAYFITICTEGRVKLLSNIIWNLNSLTVELTTCGRIAEEELLNLQQRYSNLMIDNYVIMPNHIHILLRLENAGGASPSPTVPDIIGAYKSLTTRSCKKSVLINKLFQRSYYDHIIRNEADYMTKYKYIEDNPYKWSEDEYNV